MSSTHNRKGDQKNNSSVGSLTRGIKVLRYLAQHKKRTATEIARHLGIHQSSASRILRSLEQEHFVYKPDYHSFALDYGVLLFAGLAMDCFPSIAASAKVCNDIHASTGYGAASAIMLDGRLIYKATIGPVMNASLELINDPSFPIHVSSAGLLLAYHCGKNTMLKMVRASQEKFKTRWDRPGEELYETVDQSMQKHGFLFLKDFASNRFNGAMLFEAEGTPTALAVYSESCYAKPERIKDILQKGIRDAHG